MSLLDFAKDMGSKLFARDDEAAKNIKQHLDVALTDASKIDVEFDNGVVKLCGQSDSQKTKELAILLTGNVKGVGRVVADELVPLPAPAKEVVEEIEYYEIERGDTFGATAKQFYGKAGAYRKIFQANREIIKDPNMIHPGRKIRIPKAWPAQAPIRDALFSIRV